MLKHILGFIFVLSASTMWIYLLYSLASPDPRLVFPKTIPEIQALSNLLLEYKHESLIYTLVFFSSAYLYKQAFAIPGSVFLNLLSGALFGPIFGFLLVCVLSAVGASFCFLISKYVTHGIITRFFPQKIQKFEKLVQRNSSNLFYFLLSLRLFPMTPNWLLNMSCPHVGVPLSYFFFSVLVGLSPFNFLSTQAGEMLKDIDSVDDIISVKVGVGMSLLALAVLGPTFIKRGSGEKSK